MRVQSSMRVGSRYVCGLRHHVPPCADLEQDGQEADGRGQGQEGGGLVGKQELMRSTAVAFDNRTRWESGMAIASRCRTSVPFLFCSSCSQFGLLIVPSTTHTKHRFHITPSPYGLAKHCSLAIPRHRAPSSQTPKTTYPRMVIFFWLLRSSFSFSFSRYFFCALASRPFSSASRLAFLAFSFSN